VAVLGSLTAANYHGQMQSSAALAHLAPGAHDTARDSIGGAVAVANRLGGGGTQLLSDASAAFVHAMSTTALVGALVALAGAAVAWRFLPARDGLDDVALASGTDGEAGGGAGGDTDGTAPGADLDLVPVGAGAPSAIQ
jgi:hypothetical protein